MKIDRGRIKKSTIEVPSDCLALIEKLRSCSRREILEALKKIDSWTFGKCELYHWIDILDICDSILECATEKVGPKSWQIACDLPENHESKELLLWVLHFTTLLIEHSFSRHLYNSTEHLLTLLSSCDLNVVLGVLNLLYMFSKRSNFITRINPEMRTALLKSLTYLAESWGGRENGFGLADCVREDADIPPTATTLHYEFYTEDQGTTSQASCIHLDHVDQINKLPSEIMDGLIETFNVPKDGHMSLFTHLRLAHSFSDHGLRLKCVQARLQALSVLLYSNADSHNLLYPGLLDELVQLLELNNPGLVEIRSAALRTLTSIIHLDRSPHLPKKPGSRLNMIIDVTGAGLYHGFLPQLVRSCITSLTSDNKEGGDDQFPLPLATALFSFLYHLASYEAGGEALVSCGMMESLLRVINWPGVELEHITFVTRAVRVIDLITNIDMQSFQSHGGLNSFINRLQMEIAICRQEKPFEIQVPCQRARSDSTVEGDSPPPPNNSEAGELDEEMVRIANSVDRVAVDSDSCSCSKDQMPEPSLDKSQIPYDIYGKSRTCLQQRAALLKSMLNFLKKALQDPAFSESIRHVMDGSLPSSLKHIISNCEYYGPSLFLLATDVVAVYVFQEPSLLSSLQDVGITEVVLHALLIKHVPATREVLGSVPNVFSALCLNQRGLQSFTRYKPFEKLFKVLISPNYLSAMRRRRSSDPAGDTASNLGNAMDELMRHQPTLKAEAISAIIKLLQDLCQLGRDPRYVCWKSTKGNSNESPHPIPRVSNEAGSSDEEEEDEEEASTSSHPQPAPENTPTTASSEKTPIALMDYILNVMKFVEAILSNNSTDDHCREFVNQNGLEPLLSILGLPNLPIDYPTTSAATAVASVCRSVLNLAHEAQVMNRGLDQLGEVLERVKPLCTRQQRHNGGSILLDELARAPCLDNAFSNPQATPLLHALSSVHGYVIMFVCICRSGQADMRQLSLSRWGQEEGILVLKALTELYTVLVWESTVLLALSSDDTCREFNREDISRIFPPSMVRMQAESMDVSGEDQDMGMEVEDDRGSSSNKPKPLPLIPQNIKLKYIKPLLGSSSRLGRALAELFGVQVKLCVGFPLRARRSNQPPPPPSVSPWAHQIVSALAQLLATILNYQNLPESSIPKFKLTYLVCSVGFTQTLLFDDKRYPYHLMLLKFMQYGGEEAFFDTFRWALTGGGRFPAQVGLSHIDLPEGTGEFLDAWLLLLEKMVNPKAVLESPHTIPQKSIGVNLRFEPMKYLLNIHKMAFVALTYMWGRRPLPTYGARMTETMLLIFRHIVRGEKIVEKERESRSRLQRLARGYSIVIRDNVVNRKRKLERKQKENNETTVLVNPSAGEGRRGASGRERPEVNSTELSQLMDMGFSQEHCYEALILTSSLEHATDYLLNNFFPHNVQPPQVSEEEDLIIVEDYLTKEDLDEFSNEVLPVCLDYIERLPETVYRVCDLLTAIIRRSGEAYCHKLLNSLAEETIRNIKRLLDELFTTAARRQGNTEGGVRDVLLNSRFSTRIAGNLHLFMLLFEEIKVPCAMVVHSSSLLNMLVKLLVEVTELMEDGAATPKWMAPLLLLIDLLEKVSTCVNRKVNMHKVTTQSWRWLDLATGKWSAYLPTNNKLINEAYWRGDRDVTITSGRRRYTIAFANMCQINDDSGKARPVMMALIDPNDPAAKSNYEDQPTDLPPFSSTVHNPEEKDSNDAAESLSEVEYYVDFFHRRVGLQPIAGVRPDDVKKILKCCMKLISKPVDPDTLHAVMQVCVRFTRDFEHARLIADMDAIKRLLKLRQVSSFNGFVGLSTMLIRHILEEPANITSAMERVIRFKTLPNIPPTFKELNYILRECAPAICRNAEIFKSVAKEIMRVDVSVLNKGVLRGEEDDPRLLMKCLPVNNQKNNKEIDPLVKDTITQLLNFLVEARQEEMMAINDIFFDDDQCGDGNLPPPGSQPADALHFDENIASCSTVHRDDIDMDTFNGSNLPMFIAASGPISSSSVNKKQSSSNGQQKDPKSDNVFERKKKLPLLHVSYILKILGDAVRSYNCIAKMITDHKYTAKDTDILKEDCSAVAFVLDHLMPYRELNIQVDPDRPNMARNLIAALASCNHSPDAQCALVSEVKSALQRALAWPESAKKHLHIQDLVGVVTTMIDHCPPVPISSTPLSPALKLNQYSVNNMVRFMMRKGIVTDLARIPQNLDLSSPKMAATINAALKPLETLSRIMGQPSAGPTPSKTKPKGSATTATADDAGTMHAASSQSDCSQPTQMDQSGTAQGPEDDHVDMIEDHPTLNEVMNSVVERVNGCNMMQRMPNHGYPARRNRRPRGQRRVISDLSRFTQMLTNDLTFATTEETSQDSSSEDSGEFNPTDEDRHMEDPATDIDDHVEDDDDEDDEEEEDEDDDEDDDDDDDEEQEGEENEGEESNGGYDEDGLELFEPDDGIFSIPGLVRDSDDYLMIEYSEPDPSAPLGQPWPRDNFLPFTLFDEANSASDNAVRSAIPSQHPLMARSLDSTPSTTNRPRMSRTRRLQYIQMNRASLAAPVFLQRLIGNSEPPSYLNVPGHAGNTYGQVLASTFPNTRLIVMDNGLGILTNSEEEQISFVDQSGYLLGPSLAATLNNVPTSMYWWNEELKLFDRDSICDCSICVGFELGPYFELFRNEEFTERKEKRKKMDDEEESNKRANTSNGESEKKKIYDGLLDIFESPRPPARMPTRRIAMLSAAQEGAHTTENLAGSIVESVLHPRVVQPIQPPGGSSSPQEPPDAQLPAGDRESNDLLVVPFVHRRPQASSIPEALELIPVAPSVSEISDPMGLIPGSVPYPPPSDPEDGFFRVNPTFIGQNQNENNSGTLSSESTEEGRSTGSGENDPRNCEGGVQEQRHLGSLPVDMSSAGMAPSSQSSQNSSQSLFVLTQPSNDQEVQMPLSQSSQSSTDSFFPLTQRMPGPGHDNQIPSSQSSQASSDSFFPLSQTMPSQEMQTPSNHNRTDSLFLLTQPTTARGIHIPFSHASQDNSFVSSQPHEALEIETSHRHRNRHSPVDMFASSQSSQESVETGPNQNNSQDVQNSQPTQNSSQSSVDISDLPTQRNTALENYCVSYDRLCRMARDISNGQLTLNSQSSVELCDQLTQPNLALLNRSSHPNEGRLEFPNGEPAQSSRAYDLRPSSFNEIRMSADWLQTVSGTQSISIEEFNDPRLLDQSFSQGMTCRPAQNVLEYSPPPPPPMPLASELTSEPSQPSMSSQSSLMTDEIPEGIDPSFLAALPEEMRAEVISEHLRQQRLQNRMLQNSSQGAASSEDPLATPGPSGSEVDTDFLAALPLNLQEEVLSMRRIEQQRFAASTSNPDEPVDAAAFFQDLPHSLRQSILTDMEESQIPSLPPELAAEAQNLRREWEARNRQLMQERFLSHVSNNTTALSSILRNSSTPRTLRRSGGPRYTIQNMGPGNRTHWLSSWNLGARLLDPSQSGPQAVTISGANVASASGVIGRPKGRQVLDYESVCCLLVLLFVDDSRLNTARLHRVFRNLCYHPPTREWVVRAILSIMEKSSEGQSGAGESAAAGVVANRRVTRSQVQASPEHPAGPSTSSLPTAFASTSASRSGSSWLNISMDAALGCRATVFHVHKIPGRRNDRTITINPQAAPFVYRHALEILISLAKTFPSHFVPGKPPNASASTSSAAGTSSSGAAGTSSSGAAGTSSSGAAGTSSSGAAGTSSSTASPPKNSKTPRTDNSPSFWDLLIRLDSLSTSKKGKLVPKQSVVVPVDSESLSLECSPFGQLLKMLASPVVHRSPLLMDKLLRLLSLISISLQIHRQRVWDRLGLQVEVNPSTLHHVGLAIDVLTSNTCSEEGLEDATALLLNMTVNLPNTRENVLDLLLSGARQMASMVCSHIEQLLRELRVLNRQHAQSEEDDNTLESRITSLKGILSNRFTKDTVVVTAPKKVKAGLDLQLNSMAPLISKTSSQAFFLRILKVIVQLRESVRNFDRKKRKQAAEAQQSEPVTLRANVAQASGSTATTSGRAANPGETAMDTTQPGGDMAMDTTQSSSSSEYSFALYRPTTPTQERVNGQNIGECYMPTTPTHEPINNTNTRTTYRPTTPTHEPINAPNYRETYMPTTPTHEPINNSNSGTTYRPTTPTHEPINNPNNMDPHTAGILARWFRPTPGTPQSGAESTPATQSDNASERIVTMKLEEEPPLPPLSEQLNLDILWNTLSECLTELQHTNDNHAVLVLQPAVEAFFLVHASGMDKNDQRTESRNSSDQPIMAEDPLAPPTLGLDGLSQAPPPVSPLPTDPAQSEASTSQLYNYLPNSQSSQESGPPVPPHQLKFLKFAETHRTVLNQILRQSTTPLIDGPFAVLVNHTRVLDFDVKRRYFRGELERADEGHRREELAVHVRRNQVFEDSFRELHRRTPEEWKNRFYIVFEGEEGQDAGGLLREWYMIISREIFNPMYALFTTSPGDRVTYMINPSSHCNPNHLCYFKFVGRVIAKAIYDNKLLECYFTRSFYKHILGILVKYTDMESEDYTFYKSLVFLMENHIDTLGYELTFSTQVQEFGVTDVRDLLPKGRSIVVTEENKMEYIRLVCQMKMTGAIRKQLNAFLEGFYDIIPKRLISIFNEQELELLISGLPNVDIEDLKANTEYYKYQPNSLQIQWFWRALREFDQAERAKFLQFVTGTSKVPLQGFGALEGMNGVQKFQIHRDERSTDRLPSAHTCFNQLDLPVYETYTKLRLYLLKAIHECSEGFGFA